ncbi:extradiol dioxygenase [Mucilaginibacter mali]|uniref:Extradiol dioxygenase n=1 Tax=Mucilaginibacter mali TaxID=2740462 RepID=A0A7D4UEG0_9SPHI|nr:VOC family protein [Mucilaginibacter mali]QKJ28916.1 extradiol dioxygenase [Mucilaginibacter mali]
MTKELWINLPVKNLKQSIEFFTAIGFSFKTDSPGYTDTMAPMIVGSKGIVVMLFQEDVFKNTCMNAVADTAKGTEVLFSFDAENREEVDATATKVEAAGGTIFAQPASVQGWMYGFAFADLDGHRWNMLHMSM